jgi:hypothetical protein
VTCPAGELAIGGGYRLTFDDDNDIAKVFIQGSEPTSSGGVGTLSGDQWKITLNIPANLGGGNQAHLSAVAACST